MRARITKRLRVSVTGTQINAEATITLSEDETGVWQTTTALGRIGHASIGHRDQHSALMHAARWLRTRFANAPAGGTTLVHIRAAA